MKMYLELVFVMYYVYGASVPSLLIESTDALIDQEYFKTINLKADFLHQIVFMLVTKFNTQPTLSDPLIPMY